MALDLQPRRDTYNRRVMPDPEKGAGALADFLKSELDAVDRAIKSAPLVPSRDVATSVPFTGQDGMMGVDATSGAVTVTLPSARINAGKVIYLKKIDASANAVTVAASGTDTIDGAATLALADQYDAVILYARPTTWRVLSSAGIVPAGTISGGGTINTLAMFTAATVIGDSLVTQSAGTVTVGGNLSVTGNTTLGNLATTDTITATARFASVLTPSTSNVRDIGESALLWRTGYFGTSVITPLLTSTATLAVTSGAGALTVTATAGTLALVATSTNIITGTVNSVETLRLSQMTAEGGSTRTALWSSAGDMYVGYLPTDLDSDLIANAAVLTVKERVRIYRVGSAPLFAGFRLNTNATGGQTPVLNTQTMMDFSGGSVAVTGGPPVIGSSVRFTATENWTSIANGSSVGWYAVANGTVGSGLVVTATLGTNIAALTSGQATFRIVPLASGTVVITADDGTTAHATFNAAGTLVTLAGALTMGGHLLNATDNTYDIGASGATRFRTGYFGTEVVAPLFTGAIASTQTVWGQTLTGNVTGSLTSVGDITGTAGVTLTATAGTLGLVATGANIVSVTTNATLRASWSSAGVFAQVGNATIGGTLGVIGAVTGGTYNGQTISSAASFTGTVAIASTLTLSNDLIMVPVSNVAEVRTNTTDGSDTAQFSLTPASSPSNTRGALVSLYGNEHATQPGRAQISTGNVSGADLILQWGGNAAMTITRPSANLIAFTGDATISATLAVTTSVTSALLAATTRVTAPLLGTTSAVDVVFDRNSVTQLTLGSLAATFAGTVAGTAFSGTTWTGTGLIQTTLTTEQLRLSYDGSNYLSATVDNDGDVTFALTGTTPEFFFGQRIRTGSGGLWPATDMAGTLGDATRRFSLGFISGLFAADGDFSTSVAVGTTLTVQRGAVINDGGGNFDTRIEGDTLTHLIFADASADFVGINNAAPAYRLDVVGDVNATAYRVGAAAGASFSGAITNLTVVNGIVTAAS